MKMKAQRDMQQRKKRAILDIQQDGARERIEKG